MKRATLNHPKLKALMLALGVSRREAIGLLTLLWDFTGQYAPTGIIGRYTNEAIAEACDWTECPDVLVSHLVRTGWMDEVPDQSVRLVIHDWPDHCEQWVRKRLTRENATFYSPNVQPERPDTSSGRNGYPKRLPSPTPSLSLSPAEPGLAEAEPQDSDSLASALVCSDSDSGQDARTAAKVERVKAHLEYHDAVSRLFGKSEKQRRADQTVADRWWDEQVWPEALEHNRARERLVKMLGLIRQAAERDRPMAWLTRRVATWRRTGG